MSSSEFAVETTRLTKDFDSLRAVNEIDLTIKKSEIFGLLGPNGAGKTTTIRLLSGMLIPTFGKAKVLGMDSVEKSLQIREKTGLLTETPSIYDRLSVRENLTFFGRIYGVKSEDIQKNIKKLLEIFDLEERIDSKAGTLSKGMKQKVAIARTLIHDPELIFLDEPTASLAPESAKIVRDLILNLAKESNKTFFIATHNLYEAEILCDRVAIINRGNILAVGKPKELKEMMKGETYTIIRFQEWNNEVENFLETNNYKISNLVQEERKIQIKLKDIEKETPPLIKKLIENNYNIVEVFHERPSLEKIYLELVERETNGGVK
ncbi:MAG: ATP-binding cassette domain-containing protein [Candidatus Heimdallarchaeaceae archaeon]